LSLPDMPSTFEGKLARLHEKSKMEDDWPIILQMKYYIL